MKVVILAGGYGTRIAEETGSKPKPTIEIGGKPILWHIMKLYSHYGFNDFIICLGYKGYVIKEYFANYFLHMGDVTFNLMNNSTETHRNYAEPWKVTLVETGVETLTGGRVKRVASYIGQEPFMLTYGDGLSNVNITQLVSFHKEHGKIATITATQPPGRFGALVMGQNDVVRSFMEKPDGDGSWINGGFFVMQPEIFNYIKGDDASLERDTLEGLACDNQLVAFKHTGFWQPMDTLRDKNILEDLWQKKEASWKVW